ncbi:unnamed protein product [Caenorhabditis sp. 36 PRJEB53466]|nr:unnamed protein product [Caenorhabditis sp. 36 PRJEB53466]
MSLNTCSVAQQSSIDSLKRPDLRGKYICGVCGQQFAHNASLSKHRRAKHTADLVCLICMVPLDGTQRVQEHMKIVHQLQKVVTCGCCNWTFRNRADLGKHGASVRAGNLSGDVQPVAVNNNAPGSLHQSTVKGIPRVPRKKSCSRTSSPGSLPSSSRSSSLGSVDMNGLYKLLESSQVSL